MLNVVIPITDKLDKYRELLGALQDMYDSKILIGATEEQYSAIKNEYNDVENFCLFEFKNGVHKEVIINSLQDYLAEGPIMVLRKPIAVKEFNKMLSLERDVVTSKVVRGKFSAFMFKMWQRLTKLLLGVKMYAGDTSAIFFEHDIAEVVRHSGSLSYSSRVNRWKGIKQAVISTTGEAESIKRDKKFNIIYILSAIVLVAVATIVTTLVAVFADVSIIVGLLLICIDAICLIVACILIVMLIFNNMTGKRNYGKSEIINKNEKEI